MNNDALDTSDKLIRNKNWPQEGAGPSLDEGAASKRHTVPLPESGLVEEMNGRVSGDKNMNSSMNSGSSSRPRSTGSTGPAVQGYFRYARSQRGGNDGS